MQQCGSDVRKHNLAYRTLPHLCKSKPKWDIVMKLSEMLLRRIIVTCRCWHICHKSTDAARSTRITKLMSLEQKHPCGKSTRRTCWHTAIKHSQSTPYNYFAVGREPQTQQERAHCTKNVLLYHWKSCNDASGSSKKEIIPLPEHQGLEMSFILWSEATPMMAHFMSQLRETPNSSERLKTKVAGQEVHRAIARKMLKANTPTTRFTHISKQIHKNSSVCKW